MNADRDGTPTSAHALMNLAKKYTKEVKLGEGTYAVVYSGKEIATGRVVAIKKIKIGQFKEGLDMSAIREVKFLRECKHENVIELIDVFSQKQNLNLILEFLIADLEMLIKDRSIIFSPSDVKSWMLMTLRGLFYLHSRFILHRDLKPNNLLLSEQGVLKIADFGLARDFGSAYVNMSPQVVTRWYRAPELLLGAKSYSYGIDIWAVGCIFAELLLRIPYLPGDGDMNQLETIFRALGTPNKETWPGLSSLSQLDFKQYPPSDPRGLFTAASEDELSMMSSMLKMNPQERPSAKEVLRSKYFSNLPRPTAPENLPKKGGGLAKVANDLKRPHGMIDEKDDQARKVARKLF